MFAILVLVFIILLIYTPSFKFKFQIGNKEVVIQSSEINNSETSE
jgi:hypothetical protein